jgi:glycerol-3-phosphate dehydrogenase (NAD(P)+)
MKIVILGNGCWGPALASVLKENGNEVSIWDEKNKIEKAQVYVNCLPVQYIRELLKLAQIENSKKIIFVSGSKGIEKGTGKLPNEIVREIIGKKINYFCLIGPSFAAEVVEKMPTMVNIGYDKKTNKEIVKNIFETEFFKVKLTKGIKQLELAGALKNVYAIGCGLADGLGYKWNTRAWLISMAIDELRKIIKVDTSATIGTIGDLILTCNSEESRNFQFGKLLAKNKIEKISNDVCETIEGVCTIESIRKYNMPLLNFIADVVKADDPTKIGDEFCAKLVK